jgi:Tetratricopeptide repeat-like domain
MRRVVHLRTCHRWAVARESAWQNAGDGFLAPDRLWFPHQVPRSKDLPVRTTERRQLKHDRFAETAAETYSWAAAHRDKLLWAGLVLAIILVAVIGVYSYVQRQSEQANLALADAMRTYNAQIGPANPATPEEKTYPTVADRAKAAHSQFEAIADKYGRSDPGKIARYMGGVTALQMGDAAMAERELNRAADNGGADVSSLAKLALAGVYRSTNRDQQAIDTYKYLIDHPTNAVGKSAAELELASLYETKQPGEAKRLYEEIKKDAPNSMAAEIATTKLSGGAAPQ